MKTYSERMEYIGNKKSKVIHRVVSVSGHRWWREGCSAADEDVFATEAEALEAIEKVDGWTGCGTCWPPDGVLTFPGDAAETVTALAPEERGEVRSWTSDTAALPYTEGGDK